MEDLGYGGGGEGVVKCPEWEKLPGQCPGWEISPMHQCADKRSIIISHEQYFGDNF